MSLYLNTDVSENVFPFEWPFGRSFGMTLMLQCDIICIHFHTLYLCAKPMKVPKRESQFCQTYYYIWNTAVKCPLSEAVGDIYNFQCSTLPTTLQRSVISPHVFCWWIWMKRGKVFPSLKTHKAFYFNMIQPSMSNL